MPITRDLSAPGSWRWPGPMKSALYWSPSSADGAVAPRTSFQTLDDLHGWKVSVLAQTGLSFDLSTASGKLMRTITVGLAEFERDLIRDRVKSSLAAARARGVKLGRQVGQRPSDKKAKRVLGMHADGLSYSAHCSQRGHEQEHGDGHREARSRLGAHGATGGPGSGLLGIVPSMRR